MPAAEAQPGSEQRLTDSKEFHQNLERTLIAVVLVTIAVGVNLSLGIAHHDLAEFLSVVLVGSQLTWAAIWLVKGEGWLLVRLLPGPAILESVDVIFPTDLSAQFFVVSVVLLLLHSALQAKRAETSRIAPIFNARRQFTLRHLLEVLTLVAICIGVTRRQGALMIKHIDIDSLRMVLLFALSSLGAAWAAMGSLDRIMTSSLALPLGVVLLFGLLFGRFLFPLLFLLLPLLPLMILVGTGMLVYRAYRHLRTAMEPARVGPTSAFADPRSSDAPR